MLSIIRNAFQKNKPKPSIELQESGLPVSVKLNFVNLLIIVSCILSLLGAYKIQLGGKMHELNYFHQKYITQLVKEVKTFENSVNANSTSEIQKFVNLVREQPVECIELVGSVELFMMKLIGTEDTVQVCYDDLTIADNLLDKIQIFESGELDKRVLVSFLYKGVVDFEHSGFRFEPLVSKTVAVVFFIIISLLIANAFVVPIISLTLSKSVSRDYQQLLEAKRNLEQEKNKNALIQSEKIASLTIMVAGMAHEINTPIGVSVTANSYLEDVLGNLKNAHENKTLTQNSFVSLIREMEDSNTMVAKNLSRTAKLVHRFKQVSVGQIVDERQQVKLKVYIEHILSSLSCVLESKNVTYSVSCNSALEVYICEEIFSQIITNLVTNAVEHAFKNRESGTLTIKVEELIENEINFSFEDDGCGISETDKVHIFDPFFTTYRNEGGTGLGLHILHNLVTDKLKGQVLCSSTVNVGTRFDIHFPNVIKESDIPIHDS